MSEDLGDPAYWRKLAEGEETRARVLAEACQALDHRSSESYATRSVRVAAGVPSPDLFTASETDRLRWVAEWERARADYLEKRYHALRERAAFRAELAEAGRRGFERFAPGLDGDLDVVREQIRQVGGLTHNHLVELGRDQEGD